MSEYTRRRTRGTLTSGEIRQVADAPNGGHYTDKIVGYVYPVSGYSESINDNTHSNFRSRMKKGEIIMSDMSITRQEFSSDDSTFTIGPFSDWGYCTLSGPLAALCGGQVPQTNFNQRVANARGEVINAAFAKMNSSPLLAGEFVADIRSTLGMLRSPFKSASSLLAKIAKSKLRRMSLKKSLSGPRAFADAWLEYRYGWQPLIRDTAKAVEEAEKARLRHVKVRLVARASKEITHFEKSNFMNSDFGEGALETLSAYGEASAIGKCKMSSGVLYEVTTPPCTSEIVLSTLGLTMRDIPATLWETIPFSFVVDWFCGVGNWIQASTPNPYVTPLGAWVTEVKDFESVSSPEVYYRLYSPPHDAQVKRVGNATWKIHEVIRDTDIAPTNLPPLRGVNLSVVQLIDGLSLTCQKLISNMSALRR